MRLAGKVSLYADSDVGRQQGPRCGRPGRQLGGGWDRRGVRTTAGMIGTEDGGGGGDLLQAQSEPVFLNVYGAQELIPRNEFRQPM